MQQSFLSLLYWIETVSHTTHTCPAFPTDLIQLPLGLILHPTNVLHSQINPLIQPAKELPMEVCEETLFLLQEEVEQNIQGRLLTGQLIGI